MEFSGYVTRQAGNEWQIDGVKVVVSLQTKVPDQPVVIGDAVRVKGQVQSHGLVVAEEIKLLAPGSVMPEVDGRETEFEEPDVENSNQKNENNSISGSETETPEPAVILTPTLKSKVEDISLEGSVTSVENAFVVVNGVVMDISKAEVEGSAQIGTIAKAEGHYDTSGIFIVTKIEFKVVSYDEGVPHFGRRPDGTHRRRAVEAL